MARLEQITNLTLVVETWGLTAGRKVQKMSRLLKKPTKSKTLDIGTGDFNSYDFFSSKIRRC